jgi:hypothetical protein
MLSNPPRKHCFLPRSLALLVLAAGAARSSAQSAYWEQPLPDLTMPRLKYVDLNVEAEQSGTSGGGSQMTYQRLYVSPTVGIGWDYFLYHPDLLTFSLLAEPGYVWQSYGSSQSMSQENDLLLNGSINATLLQLKPYASTVYASSSHDTRQYDFFNTVVEDVQTFGATTGYREGAVPFTVSFQKTMNNSSGFTYNSTSDQTMLNLHAVNERSRDNNTDLTYQYQDSTWNQSTLGGGSSSSTHDVTLTDAEHYGKSTLNSSLMLDQSDYSGTTADSVNLALNLSVEHTPHLRSFYDYGVARYSTDGGSSLQNTARAGLQHQLYESLTSSVDLHGSSFNSDYSDSTLDAYSGGTAASVNYSKNLGGWGHLTLGTSGSYDLTQQESSGTALLIPDEAHILNTGQWVRLNHPRDIDDGNFRVTTAGHLLLTEGTDYYVNRTTDPWQIQISPFSLLITSGATVLVTYDVQPNPSGNYSTFTDISQARLDFWKGLMDVYVRYNYTDNNASSPGFVLENIRQFEAGTDFNWKRLHLGANYTDDQSSLFSYYSYSATEAYSLITSSHSSLSLNLNQQWSYYPANGGAASQTRNVSFYNNLLHYEWHPLSILNWSAEVGLQQERGDGLDQDLLAARTYLNWTIGKLDLHLGYEYENQQYVGIGRERNFIFLRARRNF